MMAATAKAGLITNSRGNMTTLISKQPTWKIYNGENETVRLDRKNVVSTKKEVEMLVTNKINIFAFLFGKHNASSQARVANWSKAQTREEKSLSDLESRFNKAKIENFNKAQATFISDPFGPMNR